MDTLISTHIENMSSFYFEPQNEKAELNLDMEK